MARTGEGEGDKGAKVFCPGWRHQPGQNAPVPPPLVRLAVGPGTKATYCLGPKGCRDKWLGTKAYFAVVFPSEHFLQKKMEIRSATGRSLAMVDFIIVDDPLL